MCGCRIFIFVLCVWQLVKTVQAQNRQDEASTQCVLSKKEYILKNAFILQGVFHFQFIKTETREKTDKCQALFFTG